MSSSFEDLLMQKDKIVNELADRMVENRQVSWTQLKRGWTFSPDTPLSKVIEKITELGWVLKLERT